MFPYNPPLLAAGDSFHSSILGTERLESLLQSHCLVLKHCRSLFKGENIIRLELNDVGSRPSFWFVIFPEDVLNFMCVVR